MKPVADGERQYARKKVLLLFPYEWFQSYSTATNLYALLSDAFDMHVVTFEPRYFTTQKLDWKNVHYVTVPARLNRLVTRIQNQLARLRINLHLPQFLRAFVLLRKVRTLGADEIIAADFLCLWVAQRATGAAHLLSVDIDDADVFYRLCDQRCIQSVIIPSMERYRHLFPGAEIVRFLVHNAPIYRPLQARARTRGGLVYCGTSIPQWGIFTYLKFLVAFPEFTLTLKGFMPAEIEKTVRESYGQLIEDGRLVIDKSYVPPEKLAEYLSNFLIGLCVYHMDEIDAAKKYNQLTGSYGKIFSYFSAGVPVVASNLPGMRPVIDFDTGVLIDDLSPAALKEAIDVILTKHEALSQNCLRAAERFSFEKAIQPFIDFLLSRRQGSSNLN